LPITAILLSTCVTKMQTPTEPSPYLVTIVCSSFCRVWLS
jgi:hypothetical protein